MAAVEVGIELDAEAAVFAVQNVYSNTVNCGGEVAAGHDAACAWDNLHSVDVCVLLSGYTSFTLQLPPLQPLGNRDSPGSALLLPNRDLLPDLQTRKHRLVHRPTSRLGSNRPSRSWNPVKEVPKSFPTKRAIPGPTISSSFDRQIAESEGKHASAGRGRLECNAAFGVAGKPGALADS